MTTDSEGSKPGPPTLVEVKLRDLLTHLTIRQLVALFTFLAAIVGASFGGGYKAAAYLNEVQIRQNEIEISRLEDMLNDKASEIELNKNKYTNEIHDLSGQLNEQEVEIESLRGQNRVLVSENQSLQNKMGELEDSIEVAMKERVELELRLAQAPQERKNQTPEEVIAALDSKTIYKMLRQRTASTNRIREQTPNDVYKTLGEMDLSNPGEFNSEFIKNRWLPEAGWSGQLTRPPAMVSGSWRLDFEDAKSKVSVYVFTEQDVAHLRPGDRVRYTGMLYMVFPPMKFNGTRVNDTLNLLVSYSEVFEVNDEPFSEASAQE